MVRAAVILLCYGVVWASVRGQHPYRGPSGGAIIVLYAAVFVVILVTVKVVQRATVGVSGQSRRQRALYGAAYGSCWIAVSVFQGALYHDGMSHAVVYRVIPVAMPLMVLGAAVGGMAAAQENWKQLGVAVAVIALGAGSAFAGPAGAWGVIAVGGCVMALAYATYQVWQRRHVLVSR